MKRIKDLIRFNTFGSNGVFDITVNYYTRAITKKKKGSSLYKYKRLPQIPCDLQTFCHTRKHMKYFFFLSKQRTKCHIK